MTGKLSQHTAVGYILLKKHFGGIQNLHWLKVAILFSFSFHYCQV